MIDMQHTHVANLDLRSLDLLSALLQTASITRAGEAFGLSQPAASRAVAHLRRALGDPLLVRTAKGYVLTPRAEALKPKLADARRAIEGLFATDRFDPATSRRAFLLATTDYGALTVVSAIAQRFAAAAPLARLVVLPWQEDTLAKLESGEIDAALYADASLPPDFHARGLFRETYVAVCDAGSARASQALEKMEFSALPRIVILYPESRRLLPDDVLGSLGAPDHRVALSTPYFAAVPAALLGTDRIAALPKRLAQALGNRLMLVDLPTAPAFSYRLIWHRRMLYDPGHRWLRHLIGNSFTGGQASKV